MLVSLCMRLRFRKAQRLTHFLPTNKWQGWDSNPHLFDCQPPLFPSKPCQIIHSLVLVWLPLLKSGPLCIFPYMLWHNLIHTCLSHLSYSFNQLTEVRGSDLHIFLLTSNFSYGDLPTSEWLIKVADWNQ